MAGTRLPRYRLCHSIGKTFRSEKQPVYELLHKDDNKEIRHYRGYLVATTWSAGKYAQASKRGFRRLFDYISGHNSGQQHITMTAPVHRPHRVVIKCLSLPALAIPGGHRLACSRQYCHTSAWGLATTAKCPVLLAELWS